jgi:RNA polymerase sigma-70 factor (ECF subfamily)
MATMTLSEDANITGLIERIRANDSDALGELFSQLYDELRHMASQLLTREPPGHTLQTTALLNEALRRLLEDDTLREASDRRFLFATIHMAMRRVLVDHARRRITAKRGGAYERVPLDDVIDRLSARWSLSDVDLIAIHEAMGQLEKRSVRQREVIDLKVFGCLSNREIADQLGVSAGTVERDFRLARAFLSRQLDGFVQ